ncbi:MAG: gluconokinase [Holophagales bacterium]|nr:gluconokinase [Holophagales bacterium]
MGVCGCGKTTVGRRLSEELGWEWLEGDHLHPAANVEKMGAGHSLDDHDREPWLDAIRLRIDRVLGTPRHPGLVVACSALKRIYRRRLGTARPGVRVVHLRGSRELLERRLRARRAHFMPESLLQSQLDTLEPPTSGWALDVARPPAELVREILGNLGP